jgi:hypothetical protein
MMKVRAGRANAVKGTEMEAILQAHAVSDMSEVMSQGTGNRDGSQGCGQDAPLALAALPL